MLKLPHVTESRNGQGAMPLLEFQFNFVLPKPRKERDIIIRNHLGQIVSSVAKPIYPEMSIDPGSLAV
ncbi:hypothetical protein A2572_02440 [Candidatus Collierbacteria bacterium RIFOXYD1_FULL_40_9]|uniref:Uncharacterized protein n=1 Tax=Candidatus Collierbacteria bacterium RIFOXYD1_FULL_40_9 TaxID=1817731 RepID=A0A1F5FP90_9BACT|nr:MAG: hypothetical protein A2572_02440 [Candidatus Collierbacteria bacterium RIFOXYD1_FULL_40_9]